MHELGIVFNIVKTVETIVEQNQLSQVDRLVLQIGELSTVVPKYIEACFPAAVDGTFMEETTLEIEILPGNGRCKHCSQVFNIIKNRGFCPCCEQREWELLCGKEFLIKEIIAV